MIHTIYNYGCQNKEFYHRICECGSNWTCKFEKIMRSATGEVSEEFLKPFEHVTNPTKRIKTERNY